MKQTVKLLCAALASGLVVSSGPAPADKLGAAAKPPARPAWVVRSDKHAQVLLAVLARFRPEFAGQLGVEGLDEQVLDLKPGFRERSRQAVRAAKAELERRLTVEREPAVRQDLEIMIKSAQDNLRESELGDKYEIYYLDLPQTLFLGVRSLLDEQIPEQRRAKVVARLRRYAGLEAGEQPIAALAEARIRESLARPGLLGPPRLQVEKDLANASFFVGGIGELVKKYKIGGTDEALTKLKQQLASYDAFMRAQVLPRARTDFRLPPEQYAFLLDHTGVDIPPAELAAKAHAAFDQIQKQMQALAPQVAKQRGWKVTDYRDVIRELKKEQLVGDAILPHYQTRLKELEAIIARQHLVSLPVRPARIRLASEAESASIPAPNMRPPRLLGNTGEQAEFVLPLNIPAPPGSKETKQHIDDFTFAAASWTLTAHEARPGHELQFDSMIETGVSAARAVFAFNSTNVEGWGLYAESISLPFMPPDGQLISLQHRLMRAARAFLDPELQAGKVTPAQAKQLLLADACLSEGMANQEVERYTFRSPGQATAYFYGYTKLNELRAETEKALGSRFVAQKFHDFILAEGMLPPRLLRQAVLTDFVARRSAVN
jgi:hypothetical protein